ncbi:Hpt domain-containing protein [Tropicibacter oceani]|uniref:Hpt domain-containing protein n=1 Tax=Tropicibacter oceani TaxID=3058420 RepID=A0ABY8QJI3_9RHOB|nr:Hpt domain-containing protein [Tropicibacter oceani]WGW04603.1 Hpt domain-containing protein [Tropicibacter oceani]
MIDWARVAELRDEIGPEDFDEVVELFLTEVEGAIDLLESAAGNPVVTHDQMHFLKGAALNLGFAAVSDLCQKGEKAAAGGDAEAIPFGAVRTTFEDSKNRFLAELPLKFAA